MTVLARRRLLAAAALTPLAIWRPIASAQGLPDRPIRLIVGFPPGTGPDLVARLLAQRLAEQLRQQQADLQALAQAERQGLKLPAAAAAWLAETMDGVTLQGDKPWAKRLALLDEAAALNPDPAAALQAQLRKRLEALSGRRRKSLRPTWASPSITRR